MRRVKNISSNRCNNIFNVLSRKNCQPEYLFFIRKITFCENSTRRPSVSDKRIRNIPEIVLVRRGAVGFLGISKGGESWVKGRANGVSLQAT
jgi:hypothetical protein